MSEQTPYPVGRGSQPGDQDGRLTAGYDAPHGAPYDLPPPGEPMADLETQWRRLDPRMLLIHPVRELVRFVPALVAVFIAGSQGDGQNSYWELIALVAVVGLGVARYLTTTYRIEDGQIELRKGLVTKQVIATPADRVRTVDVTAPILHRVLHLGTVEIGTAGTGKERLVLDALPMAEARRLREELIHRRRLVPGADLPAPQGQPVEGLAAPPAGEAPGQETVLLTLDPRWMAYAPLTLTGVFSALAILGFGNQLLQRYLERADLGGAVTDLGSHPLWVEVVVGLVALAVLVSVLAVIGYALQYWGFQLTRHRGGTLHVRRGLTTTRETSIEERRLRGVEIGQPLGLRLAGGGRLHAITTGLSRKEQERGSAWLVPPAPRSVVARVAAEVVQDEAALTGDLLHHGPAARRRRYTRAVVPAVGLAVIAWGLVAALDWPVAVGVVGLVPLVASPFLAADRFSGLGHLLTRGHLVVRQGSFVRRRDVLEREGVIGWRIEQSLFQRRVGLAHVLATTAGGKQAYTVYDVPLAEGVALAAEVDPDLLAPFLVSPS